MIKICCTSVNRFYLHLVMITLSLFCPTFTEAQSLNKELLNIITYDTDITFELTPGFVVAILDGNNTYIESFGGHIGDRSKALSGDEMFEIGSITKLFTADLINIAQQEGKLDLGQHLNDFLPEEYRNPRFGSLSLQQLLNHQSGLPRRPGGFGIKEYNLQNPYAFYTSSDLLKSYSSFVPEGMEMVYSHMNYGLLQIVLEDVYDASYDDIVRIKILEPLEMTNSFVDFKEDRGVLVEGQDRSGEVVPPWEFASHAGSEGLKSSAIDLIKFLRCHMSNSKCNWDINTETLFDSTYQSFNEYIEVANGWQILRVNKKMKAAIHTGATQGHSAFVGMVNETNTGVVVLSNSSIGTRDLGLLVLRMINQNWKRKSDQ